MLPPGICDIAKTTQARVIKGDIFGEYSITDKITVRTASSIKYEAEQGIRA